MFSTFEATPHLLRQRAEESGGAPQTAQADIGAVTVFDTHSAPIDIIAFSPDGTRLAIASAKARSIQVIALATRRQEIELDGYLSTVKQFVAAAASHASDSREVTSVADSLEEVLKPIRLPDDPLAASYAIGGVLQIELTRKQDLLELPDAATRLRAEIELLHRESRLLADGAMPPVSTSDLRFNPN